MALAAPSTLTSGGGSPATTHTTASVTSATNGLLLLTVHCYISTGSVLPGTPTVTGLGRTWTSVGSVVVDNSGADQAAMWLFRGMGTGATGTLTITPSSSMKATWLLEQVTGADVSGSEGSGAIVSGSFVTSSPGSIATISTVSPTLGATANMLYGVVGSQGVTSKTWNNSWTRSAEVTSNSLTYVGSGYFVGPGQLTQNVTWVTAARSGALAVEVKEALSVNPVSTSRSTTWNVAGLATISTSRATTWNIAALPGFGTPGHISATSTGEPVEPEAQTHVPAVYVSGALYRPMESSLASGNRPQMMKSSDNGSTWAQVSTVPSSGANDLEAVTVSVTGTTINITVNRDDQVWWVPFNTSTDTWGTQETVDSGLTTTAVAQAVFQVELTDGTHWVFYSDTLASTNQQIAYRKRTGTNTYGTKVSGAFGSTSTSLTGVMAVRGASDVTYVVYSDATNDHAYLRTLSATGTLSSATQVDDSGTGFNTVLGPNNGEYLAATMTSKPVYYDDAGVEVISVLWSNPSGNLYLTQWRNGVKQTSQQISSSPVVFNAAATTSDSNAAHLVPDGTDLYVAWGDATTGNVLWRKRAGNGTLGSIGTVFTSPTSDGSYYVYANVYTHGGIKYLGVVYDKGAHGNDVSFMDYNKMSLDDGPTSVTTSRATTWTTKAPVTKSAGTTWTTQAVVSVVRASSWNALLAVTSVRNTTWNVAGTLTTVATSRASTWNTSKAVTSTNVTTWATRETVSVAKATTWAVLAPVRVDRPSTWAASAWVTSARNTTWNVSGTLVPVVVTRVTTWATLNPVSTARLTQWATRRAITTLRTTRWDVGGLLANGGPVPRPRLSVTNTQPRLNITTPQPRLEFR